MEEIKKDMTIDCWDFKNCPEERRNKCPAYTDKKGKSCWIATGTMCGGVQQGNATEKLEKCHACDFYKMRGGILE